MTEAKLLRLNKVAKELNVGIETIVEFLKKKKFDIEKDPNAKITSEMYQELLKEFSSDSNLKKKSDAININNADKRVITLDDITTSKNKEKSKEEEEIFDIKPIIQGPKITGKIELENLKPKKKEEPTPEPKIEKPKETKEEKITEPQPQEKVSTIEKTEKNQPELISTEIPKIEGPKVLTKIELDDNNKKKSKKGKKRQTFYRPNFYYSTYS